ncbi:pimeloyl-[acyl-carrier protein] methyl ester esterase [Aliidiomarina iranensis]|uniref:Pimeloyl-[acyl-carrier protein] methyl ester esterase n=1 Tax=Aliidiomarina iranensis TaxID=1434071 RepID=A0A432W2D4_9GAMM|nr:pimeloyl-ACP methyl ester esterase BioH [Aliidiomarina iranensis]RUO23369.1 pimeloyl-[acyl-carrier protein] methyl ester esterase [Aliidiomarina iranensis]
MAKHSANLSLSIQGSGEPLVLLHGWGLNQAIWFPIRELLAEKFQVITVDLPGFGESAWYPGDEDFQSASSRVMAELAQSIGKPFHLAGWSLGGLFAMQMALDYPTYIKRLTTIASSPCFMARGNWPGIKQATLEAFRYQLTNDFHKTLERFLAVQALGSPAAREEIKTMRKLLNERPEPHPQALIAGLRWLAEVDLRKPLEQLTVPLLRMYGRRDSLVPIATSDAVQSYLPSSFAGQTQDGQHALAAPPPLHFTESAHAPFFTEPERFATELYRWHLGQ